MGNGLILRMALRSVRVRTRCSGCLDMDDKAVEDGDGANDMRVRPVIVGGAGERIRCQGDLTRIGRYCIAIDRRMEGGLDMYLDSRIPYRI